MKNLTKDKIRVVKKNDIVVMRCGAMITTITTNKYEKRERKVHRDYIVVPKCTWEEKT